MVEVAYRNVHYRVDNGEFSLTPIGKSELWPWQWAWMRWAHRLGELGDSYDFNRRWDREEDRPEPERPDLSALDDDDNFADRVYEQRRDARLIEEGIFSTGLGGGGVRI